MPLVGSFGQIRLSSVDTRTPSAHNDQLHDIGQTVMNQAGRDSNSRRDRETLLLGAAARLFVQYGFDKTSVADVASAAGVSKGAVYLHFESKEALLEALIVRELHTYATTWAQRVEANPKGGTIGGIYRAALAALTDSPVMAAMLRKDAQVFGSYLRRPGGLLAASRSGTSRKEFVQAMQAAGAIRRDVDPAVTAHIMNMLSYGLVSMAQVMDESQIPPVDALLEGIADLLDRALTPEAHSNPDAGKTIVRAMVDAGSARLARAKEAADHAG